MHICIKSPFKLPQLCTGKVLFFISFLFITVLASSSIVYVFSNNISPFVSGASNKILVNNETELRNEVNNAKGPTIIELNNDIKLIESLNITNSKDITLTSNKIIGFYKLINTGGESSMYTDRNKSTMYIENGAVLRLDIRLTKQAF
jgi:hypothetical protein